MQENKSREDKQFEQLVGKIAPKGKLLRTWELKRGESTQITAFEVAHPNGQTQKMVKRSWEDSQAPHIRLPLHAASEFKLLQQLQLHEEAAASRPLYLDQSGEIFSAPYVVLDYIEGQSAVSPASEADYLFQFATQLAKIHQCDTRALDLSFLPQTTEIIATYLRKPAIKLDESLNEARIRDTLVEVWPLPQQNKPVLLHGDFSLANTLWNNGQLVAAIDWEFAAVGDPLCDLAASRIDILSEFGSEAMHTFTSHYSEMMNTLNFKNLPYWDLWAAIIRSGYRLDKWFENDNTLKTRRVKHRWFTDQVFEKIA